MQMIEKFKGLTQEFDRMTKEFPTRINDNNKTLKGIEAELEDIRHIIEFVNLNASEGYAMYKRQQEILKVRRELILENAEMKEISRVFEKKRSFTEIIDMQKEVQQGMDRRSVTGKTYFLKQRQDFYETYGSRCSLRKKEEEI